MRRKYFFVFCFSLILFFVGCTTNKYYVSDSVNIHNYKFACIQNIMGYSGSAILFDMDVRLYDAMIDSGITMIGEKEIDSLSDNDKEKLLLVKYSASQNSEESIVSITFIDYKTLRPVANCRGAYSMGFSYEDDMSHAIENALEQMKMMWNN